MIEIPENILPEVEPKFPGGQPGVRVPNSRGLYGVTDPAQRAQFYFEEALGKLALAKYWSDLSTQQN